MNKTQLVTEIASTAGLTKKDAAKALDAFTNIVEKELKKGNKISLMGFGSWEVKKRKARSGVNPKTGEKIKIPARKVPKFNAGKDLKETVK
jgi:DNA-binding protein HU-beta